MFYVNHSDMEYINLNHLRQFFYVAKFESYTKASLELHVQQPAISKTIKNLEEELNVTLFEKQGRGIKLTSKGEQVFQQCHEIFGSVDNILALSKEENLPLNQTITIASNDAVSTFILPSVFDSLNLSTQLLRPVVVTGTSDHLSGLIRDKKAQIGLFFHSPKIDNELTIVKKLSVEFKLVIAKTHSKSIKTITSFIGSREIDNQKNTKFPTVQKMKKIWPDTKIKLSSNSFLTHKELVLKGLGTSILPKFLVKKELINGKLSSLLNEESFIFDLKVVCRKDSKDDPVVKRVISSLEKQVLLL